MLDPNDNDIILNPAATSKVISFDSFVATLTEILDYGIFWFCFCYLLVEPCRSVFHDRIGPIGALKKHCPSIWRGNQTMAYPEFKALIWNLIPSAIA